MEKCADCECELKSGHNCIEALLAENRELKKKLDDESIITKTDKSTDTVDLEPSPVLCAKGHSGKLKSGHDCIVELLAHNESLTLEINRLKSELETTKLIKEAIQNLYYDAPENECMTELRALKQQTMTKFNGLKQTIDKINQSINKINVQPMIIQPVAGTALSESQLLAECKQHLSGAMDLIDNKMADNMKTKTLSIIRDQLAKHDSLHNVCKHICELMDLEYSTNWHCVINAGYVFTTLNQTNLIKVKIGQLILLLYQTPTVNVLNVRARIKHNKIAKKAPTLDFKNMSDKMLSAVKAIAFEAIDRSDTTQSIAVYIANKMDVKYNSKYWQCVVGRSGILKYGTTFVDFQVNDLGIYVCDS